MIVSPQGADIICTAVRDFSLRDTLLCGQCFRWNETAPNVFTGTVGDKTLTILQEGDTLLLKGCTMQDFDDVWRDYFDLARDYGAIKALMYTDPALQRAIDNAPGLRVLRQPPWETLCSFIISQNNNIGRIKGIVARLCECFGRPITDSRGKATAYSFPDAHTIAALQETDLAPLRAGWRAGYIMDAATKVASGEVPFDRLYHCDIDDARTMLRTIKGVGPKVADCVLLYGFTRTEAFPLDVWMKRAMELYYPNGLPDCAKDYPGIAQQYLFHYIRSGNKCAFCNKPTCTKRSKKAHT